MILNFLPNALNPWWIKACCLVNTLPSNWFPILFELDLLNV